MPLIIQLSDTPITKEQLLTMYEVTDSVLFGHVISYVYDTAYDEVNPATMYNDFMTALEGDDHRCAPHFSIEKDADGALVSLTLSDAYKDVYFGKLHAQYKALLEQLDQVSDYASFIGYQTKNMVNEISRLIEDEYSHYVYMDDDYVPLDTFLRYEQADTRYYIGSIFYCKI